MDPADGRLYSSFVRTLRQQDIISFLVVFLPVLAVLKLNQYIFFTFNTSPAVILLPTGISLAAVYLGGYRMWVPLACAWFLALITGFTQPPLVFVITASIAYPLQAVIGGFVLRRFNFLGTLERTRCALILIAVALALPAIAPSILTGVQWLTGSLSASAWTTWSRAWAGGVMSIMVFTPLITTWYRHQERKTREEFIESAAALLMLVFAVYLMFWTTMLQEHTFLVLYVLFASLFWIGLRLHPRMVTTALFVTASFGMAGSIVAHPGATALNLQLLSDELFIILIAPVFFILTSLVEERRIIAQEAGVRAQELEEANRKLSQEDQTKNDFLATLAHELRNPLSPVVSSLELIKFKAQELGRPDLVELAEVAETHNATLTRLLDDLLEISRITQKKLKLKKESVEVRSVIERVLRTVDGLYKSKNHILSVSLSKENLLIEADPLRLEQILVNLLNNAAKYTAPRGYIELGVVHDPKKGWRFSVRDNGIGLAPSMRNNIFEPYVQSDDGSPGLGIGLSLSKLLVELHGGEIWAESEGLGKGSDFIVVLPSSHSVPPASFATPKSLRRVLSPFTPEKKPARTYNILIVDDNHAAADGLSKLLEHSGHSVSVVYEGYSAIERVRTEKPQVVLLDIGLPGMDGYEVARTLRHEHGYNPIMIVALTGYGQEEDKLKARHAGFNYYLTKPVGIADVEAVLAKVS